MSDSISKRMALLLIFFVMMLATRLYHFGVVPDASWALFYLGGFYLRGYRSFAVLMAGAVTMDYIATQHLGISSYCLSPAYGFLLPAYAALWFGGMGFRNHWSGVRLRSLAPLAASLSVAISVCFLLSNGSFYWLSGRVLAPSWVGWLSNFREWYPYFLRAPFAYVGCAVVVHVVTMWLTQQSLPATRSNTGDTAASNR
jgi:hypothetical protein